MRSVTTSPTPRSRSRLHISVRTVESHVSSLLRKLGVVDRRSLAALADEMAAQAPFGRGQMVGLPAKWTSFVGRAAEIGQLSEAIATGRLVTVVRAGRWARRGWPPWSAGRQSDEFPAGGAIRRPGTGASRVRSRGGGRRARGHREPPGTPAEAGGKTPVPRPEARSSWTAASTSWLPQPPSSRRSWPLALSHCAWPPVASVLA